jgi:hypothetical protein
MQEFPVFSIEYKAFIKISCFVLWKKISIFAVHKKEKVSNESNHHISPSITSQQ